MFFKGKELKIKFWDFIKGMVIYFAYGIRHSTQKAAQTGNDDRIIKVSLVDLTQKIGDVSSSVPIKN